jgi:hypothetical protein
MASSFRGVQGSGGFAVLAVAVVSVLMICACPVGEARSTITIAGTAGGTAAIKVATPWLYFSLNSGGTLGDGGAQPGLKFSPLGNSSYGADMITPGTPMEGFTVSGTAGGTAFAHKNENGGGFTIAYSSWSAYVEAASAEDILHATWTGSTPYYTLTMEYTVRASAPQIKVTTTITVATGVSIGNLAFLRFVDPDQEGSATTSNLCGYGTLFLSTHSCRRWVQMVRPHLHCLQQ